MEDWQLKLARCFYIMLTGRQPPSDFEEALDPGGYYVKHFTREGKTEKIRKAMKKERRFTAEDIYNIVELHRRGLSFRAIGRKFNPPVSGEAVRLACARGMKALSSVSSA